MHCAAIQALFVHTWPANDAAGVLGVVVDEVLVGELPPLGSVRSAAASTSGFAIAHTA